MKARYKTTMPAMPLRPTCAYASKLRKMPPLQHSPDWCSTFQITNSETVRFMIHILGKDIKNRASWSAGLKLFNEARKAKVIVFNTRTKSWCGCEYKPGSASYKTRVWVSQMRNRYLLPKT